MPSRKPAKPTGIASRDLGLFAAVALSTAALVLGCFVAFRPATPAAHADGAKIQFSFPRLHGPRVDSRRVDYNPDVLRAEMSVMFSNHVLQAVVENLGLTNRWPSDTGTNRASLEEAVERLKRSTRVRQLPSTTVVEIRVASPDPDESAALANSLAEAYTQDFQRRQVEHAGRELRRLQEEKDDLIQAAELAETKLVQLRRQSAASNTLWEASLQLTNAQRALNAMAEKIENESTELLTIREEKLAVMIMDRAEPAAPVEQRKRTINWTRVYLAGGLAGLLAGIAAVLWSRSKPKKKN